MSTDPGGRALAFTAGDSSHATDVGNAARFARDHAGAVRFCSKLGWLTWDTARYRVDDVGEVERLARETIKGIYGEAAAAATQEDRKRLAAWAAASESRAGVRSMLSLAESELGIATSAAAFDRHPWLFNTLSGVVDLKTGECHPPEPGLLITKLAPVFYLPEASCPKWLTFLDRIMDGNLELIEYLQRGSGYSLTGDTGEQVLFMPWGGRRKRQEHFLGGAPLHSRRLLRTHAGRNPHGATRRRRHPQRRCPSSWGPVRDGGRN